MVEQEEAAVLKAKAAQIRAKELSTLLDVQSRLPEGSTARQKIDERLAKLLEEM